MTNSLYLSLATPDRSRTQLAYAANYLPKKDLSSSAKELVVWSKTISMHKYTLLALLNEEMTTIKYMPSNKHLQEWQIHWVYNAIPTQMEWERKSPRYIIECDFRVIADGAKIVLLSF